MTPEEEQFVAVCRGLAAASTDTERKYLKIKNLEARKKTKLMAVRAFDIPEYEDGDGKPGRIELGRMPGHIKSRPTTKRKG